MLEETHPCRRGRGTGQSGVRACHARNAARRRSARPTRPCCACRMAARASATTAVRVQIPEGVIAVKPMPKPGWTLRKVKGKYEKSYRLLRHADQRRASRRSSGAAAACRRRTMTSSCCALSDLRPPVGHMLYVPVVQECPDGAVERWIEIPAAGQAEDELGDLPHPASSCSKRPAATKVWRRKSGTRFSHMRCGNQELSSPPDFEIGWAALINRGWRVAARQLFRARANRLKGVFTRFATLAVAMVLAWMWLGVTAHAHASLVATQPRDGAMVADAPAMFELTFSEPVSPLSIRLVRPTEPRSRSTGSNSGTGPWR